MTQEVITVNVGQAGVQMSNAIWEQYCAEHSLQPDGHMKAGVTADSNMHVFFEEAHPGKFVPRNVSVDLEANVIDEVRNGVFGELFHPEYLISGVEDAANNFARGHYTVGREYLDPVCNRIRKLADRCGRLSGFAINHSVGGGTGSGLGALILEQLAMDYRRKTKLDFTIFPSPTISTCVVEPYNALLSAHWLCDHTEVSWLLDNEALYVLCQKKLGLVHPSYSNLNSLIAKILSSVTSSLRFDGEMNVDLNEFQTNLVPFPRLHFMLGGLAPLVPKGEEDTAKKDTMAITLDVFDSQYFFTKMDDFDFVEDKYMAVSLSYRGAVTAKEANHAIQYIKKDGGDQRVSLVEWCPTGFKVGLNSRVAATLPKDDLGEFPRSVVMSGNNTCIHRVFSRRVTHKYDLLYSQRAFVHWFVGEGMEEGEFSEARESVGILEEDYVRLLRPVEDDDDYGDADSSEY